MQSKPNGNNQEFIQQASPNFSPDSVFYTDTILLFGGMKNAPMTWKKPKLTPNDVRPAYSAIPATLALVAINFACCLNMAVCVRRLRDVRLLWQLRVRFPFQLYVQSATSPVQKQPCLHSIQYSTTLQWHYVAYNSILYIAVHITLRSTLSYTDTLKFFSLTSHFH